MNTKVIGIIAVVAVAVAAFFMLRPKKDENETTLLSNPERPKEPPPPGMRHKPVPMPGWPKVDRSELRKAYDDAKARGLEMPGDLAFRKGIDAFMEYNIEFAKAKMKEEGFTMREVTELTYFGFKVMTSQAHDIIQDATGNKVSDEQAELLQDLQNDSNRDFTETMRKMVKDGKSEEERMAYILLTDETYMEQYFAITGMTPQQWDDVMAMGAVEPPEDIEPRPYTETQPRGGTPNPK